MKIFKIEEVDRMGYPSLEKYFLLQKSAEDLFKQQIKKYKAMKELCKNHDLDEGKPIEIRLKGFIMGAAIKEATVSYWEEWNTENGHEFDIYSLHLRLIEIDVA